MDDWDSLVTRLLASDSRYAPDAYRFVREVAAKTQEQLGRKGGANPHITGPELLDGLRQEALNRFGPMTQAVLAEWGIYATEDFGNVVFNLVHVGLFGASDSDNPADFREAFDFHETFVAPFLPQNKDARPPIII